MPEWERLFDLYRNLHSYDEALSQSKGYKKKKTDFVCIERKRMNI